MILIFSIKIKAIYRKNISKFCENWSILAWFIAQPKNSQTDRQTLNYRMEMKLTIFSKWKGGFFQQKIIKIWAFVQKLSWNKKTTCTKIRKKKKIFKKLFSKIWIDFKKKKKNHFEVLCKTLSSISVPNFSLILNFRSNLRPILLSAITHRFTRKTLCLLNNILNCSV